MKDIKSGLLYQPFPMQNALWGNWQKAAPKHNSIVDEFMSRIDSVLLWDKEAVDATTDIKKALSEKLHPLVQSPSCCWPLYLRRRIHPR
jgi:hypothetical protein